MAILQAVLQGVLGGTRDRLDNSAASNWRRADNVRFVPIADIHWAKDAKFASARIKLAQTGASEGTKRATRALIFIGLGFQ